MLTAQILRNICPSLVMEKAQKLAAAMNEICPQYGINTPDIMHEFIANLAEESGEFNRWEENLKYSAGRLMQVWPKRFPTMDSATPYEYNPRLLAEKVYGGRADLGNTQQGDGWIFRGGGPIQITGRKNHTQFTNYYNKAFGVSFTPEQMAEYLRTNMAVGIHSACWIFAISFKLIDEAENDLITKIVKRINGGYTNMPKRLAYYEKAKKYIV